MTYEELETNASSLIQIRLFNAIKETASLKDIALYSDIKQRALFS